MYIQTDWSFSISTPGHSAHITVDGSQLIGSSEEKLHKHVCTVTHSSCFLDVRPHMEWQESSSVLPWYTAPQLIQLSLSAISLLHSICLVWSKAHTNTLTATFTYIRSNNRSFFFKTILLYYWTSSAFEYTSFKEVHSAWRFGVLRLESQRAAGGMVSLLHDSGLLRSMRTNTSSPLADKDSIHNHKASRASFFFLNIYLNFITKEVGKKRLH